MTQNRISSTIFQNWVSVSSVMEI